MFLVHWLDEINLASAFLLLVAAWRWGSSPERYSVAVLVAMLLADEYYHLLVGPGTIYETVDLGHLVIDLAGALQFATIALFANRVYPLWLAALQIISVIAHFARMELSDIGIFAYALLNYGPFYLEIVALALGIAFHARRSRRYGVYPSWRT